MLDDLCQIPPAPARTCSKGPSGRRFGNHVERDPTGLQHPLKALQLLRRDGLQVARQAQVGSSEIGGAIACQALNDHQVWDLGGKLDRYALCLKGSRISRAGFKQRLQRRGFVRPAARPAGPVNGSCEHSFLADFQINIHRIVQLCHWVPPAALRMAWLPEPGTARPVSGILPVILSWGIQPFSHGLACSGYLLRQVQRLGDPISSFPAQFFRPADKNDNPLILQCKVTVKPRLVDPKGFPGQPERQTKQHILPEKDPIYEKNL